MATNLPSSADFFSTQFCNYCCSIKLVPGILLCWPLLSSITVNMKNVSFQAVTSAHTNSSSMLAPWMRTPKVSAYKQSGDGFYLMRMLTCRNKLHFCKSYINSVKQLTTKLPPCWTCILSRNAQSAPSHLRKYWELPESFLCWKTVLPSIKFSHNSSQPAPASRTHLCISLLLSEAHSLWNTRCQTHSSCAYARNFALYVQLLARWSNLQHIRAPGPSPAFPGTCCASPSAAAHRWEEYMGSHSYKKG